MSEDTDIEDIFAEANRRRQELFVRLAAQPLVEVYGVVHPHGSGGGMIEEDRWSLHTAFEAWHIGSESLQIRPLRIHRLATHDELGQLMDQFSALSVLRIQARLLDDAADGAADALLEKVIGPVELDVALNEVVEQLTKPVTFADQVFGTFTLDRRSDLFAAPIQWDGEDVSLHLEGNTAEAVKPALSTARQLWQDRFRWKQRIVDYAVQELLSLKNDSWRDEDEPLTSAQEFKERMALDTIAVYGDGSFEFWHADGDLFWGHSIQICGTLIDGPTQADIPG